MGEERSCPESECCSTEEETLHGEVVLKYLYLYVAGTNVQVRVLICTRHGEGAFSDPGTHTLRGEDLQIWLLVPSTGYER